MRLILPLGLLGLLGIAVLILIYIIKPNYQQKLITSTYVWKLSLKYKKKRIPINRLRNILILLCQILVLAICAFLLAKPVIPAEIVNYGNEKVAIIDASAGMLVETDGVTRFERAVDEVKELAKKTSSAGGVLSVIVADDAAYFSVQRMPSGHVSEVEDALDSLIKPEELKCFYGSADIEGAVELAELIVNQNPDTDVLLYTATNYIDKNGIEVVNVANEDEWNAAVLDVAATLNDDNFYNIEVKVGCYGKSAALTVYCEVFEPNGSIGNSAIMDITEFFSEDEEEHVLNFDPELQISLSGSAIYSYSSIHVYIEETDSLQEDNSVFVYGGEKPPLRVQYVSSTPNPFFPLAIMTMREVLKNEWDIEFVQIKGTNGKVNYDVEGFDLYIFEHESMPEKLPTDGVVILCDPVIAPKEAGFKVLGVQQVEADKFLASGVEHPITKGMNPDIITISKYQRIECDDDYTELMYYDGDPVILVNEANGAKVVLLTLDLNRSYLAVAPEFPRMLTNILRYFIPTAISAQTFEIGDNVVLNARGDKMTLSGPKLDEFDLELFPYNQRVVTPGTYTVMQVLMNGDYVYENFFVKIPNRESNITKSIDELPLIYRETVAEKDDYDLLMYIACALLGFLLIEWWLQSRENF